MGQKVAINRGGGFWQGFDVSRGGALLEEAGAFKEYFEPGPRPARVAINQRGFINQELTLMPPLAVRIYIFINPIVLKLKEERNC